MTPLTPALPVERSQLSRLAQFLHWAIPFDFIFASLQMLASLWFGDWASGGTAVVMVGYGMFLLLAQAQTRQGNLSRAINLICSGLFGANILIALLQPALFPTLAFVPLLVVMVALPYVDGRALRGMIGGAVLVTVIVVLTGIFIPPRSSLPSWFATAFLVASLLSVVALIVLLLWQFSSRLTDTLARTRAAEERYSLAARGANDGLWDWNLLTDEVYFSPRWKDMLGCSESEIGNSPNEWFSRVHPDERSRLEAEIGVHCDGLTPHFESEHRIRGANGRYRWVLSRGLAVFDESGRATRMAGSLTDITVRKQAEEQLIHDALHDALTGLPNRVLFAERLDRSVQRARRHPDYLFAVLYLDLDRFKVVNDSLGHTAGDELLVELARRLLANIRPNDTVARLGGDEFAILLDGIVDHTVATTAAERIQACMRAPFRVQHSEVVSAISIGIAYSNTTYELPEQMLRDADIALYRAKAVGRARHIIFDQAMHRHAVQLLQLEMDLRRAIERQEFVVYYQPIISLQTDRISGFEALVRWQHPERGLLEPAEFISVAEETGLIAPIGWLVLRQACRQLREWQEHFPPARSLTMSVNFSGTQLAHPDLKRHVDEILRESGINPRQLRLEITEAVMMDHAGSTTEVMAYLRALGIQLQVDDFGTGYSSLSILHRFPLNALKIDRSFVNRMGVGGEQAELVTTIVTLSHNLSLEVVAEGVETISQCERLRALGCDYAQGFLFSRPVDAHRARALLAMYEPGTAHYRMVHTEPVNLPGRYRQPVE